MCVRVCARAGVSGWGVRACVYARGGEWVWVCVRARVYERGCISGCMCVLVRAWGHAGGAGGWCAVCHCLFL